MSTQIRIAPVYEGAWKSNIAYSKLSVVVYEEDYNTYIAKKDAPAGTLPTNTDYYKLFIDNSKSTSRVLKLEKKAEELDIRVSLLEGNSSNLTWKNISDIVKAGMAEKYFNIGDQLITTWKDTQANKEYEVPLDVVAFRKVTIEEDGVEREVPGMILQWHYASPFGVQFTQNQAFYVCKEALPAGDYYFEIGGNWGNNCHGGYKYKFTTTQEVPAGGQLQIGKETTETSGMPDTNPSNWRVRTYISNDSQTPLEIIPLEEYTDETPSGTSLGTLSSGTKYNTTINNLYSASYGHNRWKNSALRQFLNSDAEKGNWYTNPSDDVFARKPDQLSSKDGFLKGVDAELLAVIKAVKISTAINNHRDSGAGVWDYTFDKFFLPSLEEVYCVPQISGEGEYWDYWRQKSGLTSPNPQGSTNANMITYAVENHSSAQVVRLRSATRNNSYSTWCINASGGIYNGYGTYACRFAPACVIC